MGILFEVLRIVCFAIFRYIHQNISMRFLNCDPNYSHRNDYIEEAAEFYKHPEGWLKAQYPHRTDQLPTHVVMFNHLEDKVHKFLDLFNYVDCMKMFHTHLPEGRVGSHVLVKCQRKVPVMQRMQHRRRNEEEQMKEEKSRKTKKKKTHVK